MRRLSRYLVIFIAVLSFASVMPWLYTIAFGERVERKYVSYSIVIDDFVYGVSDKSGSRSYYDFAGNEYINKDYIRLLPLMYFRDLSNWGEYPDIIGGELVSAERARTERDFVNIRAYFIDKGKIRVQLFPMFESDSGMTELAMPAELFRIDKRMEFINAETNSVNEEKSVLFTDALNSAGFSFPSKNIWGNTDPRKSYDFGYFVLDSADNLFHIYQAKGQPVVRNTNVRTDGAIEHIAVKEAYMTYYGLLVTDTGNVYRINNGDYALEKLYMGRYNPAVQHVLYQMDPLNIVVKVSDEFSESIYVSDRKFNPVKNMEHSSERRIRGIYRTVYDIIFPFEIKGSPYRESNSPVVELSGNFPQAITFSAFFAVMYFVVRRRRASAVDILFILAGGIYSLFAIVLLDTTRRR